MLKIAFERDLIPILQISLHLRIVEPEVRLVRERVLHIEVELKVDEMLCEAKQSI